MLLLPIYYICIIIYLERCLNKNCVRQLNLIYAYDCGFHVLAIHY